MGRKPLVSVIIPCWNAGPLVGQAIESALGQTYRHKEVVVVDDGSTDDSVDVIRAYGNRIRWESGPNRGGGVARNRGLELAAGDLIQFLDADDLLFSNKLEYMVPLLVEAGADFMAICDWEVKLSHGSLSRRRLVYDGQDPLIFCLESNVQTSSPLHWKRRLVEVGGFDPALPCCQEFDLHLRLACHNVRLVATSEVLYRQRRQPGSVSDDLIKVLDQHLPILRRIHLMLEERNALTVPRKLAIAEMLAHDGRVLVRKGELDRAATYFSGAADIDRGGAGQAFHRPLARALARLIGPVNAERLIQYAARSILARTAAT